MGLDPRCVFCSKKGLDIKDVLLQSEVQEHFLKAVHPKPPPSLPWTGPVLYLCWMIESIPSWMFFRTQIYIICWSPRSHLDPFALSSTPHSMAATGAATSISPCHATHAWVPSPFLGCCWRFLLCPPVSPHVFYSTARGALKKQRVPWPNKLRTALLFLRDNCSKNRKEKQNRIKTFQLCLTWYLPNLFDHWPFYLPPPWGTEVQRPHLGGCYYSLWTAYHPFAC